MMLTEWYLVCIIAKTVQTKFDASTLHSNTALAAQTQMVDDGTGSTEVNYWNFCVNVLFNIISNM